MVARVSLNPDELAAFCRQHGIRKLAFFGSVLRADFSPQSDVDVLLEFEPEADRRLSYFRLARIQLELEQLLGRRVDLTLTNALDQHLRQEILQSAEVQYDAA
ncbi:MAG: nucleotidyltransferase domain-containing protein [Pirellulales bacterium]